MSVTDAAFEGLNNRYLDLVIAMEKSQARIAELEAQVAARDACIEAYEEAYNTIKGATDPFHATTIRQADKEIAEARRLRAEQEGK